MTAVRTNLAGRGLGSRLVYRVVSRLVWVVLRLYNRVEVRGAGRLPPGGAYVVAPVHRSNMDTLAVSMITRRRLRFMGKDSLWKVKAFAWLLTACGGFPVTRGTADREALKRCVEVLEGGEPLVLFPEGERKSGDEVQPLFDGAAYVAARVGVPIVPVGIAGSERVMPVGAKLIRPSKIVVVVGDPIVVGDGAPGAVPRRAVRSTTTELHEALQRLYDEASAALR